MNPPRFSEGYLAILCILSSWAGISRSAISRRNGNEMDHIFICGDGAHIPIEWVCDGQIDCLTDNLDEEDCGGGANSLFPDPLTLPLLRPGPSQFGKSRKEIDAETLQNLKKLPSRDSLLKTKVVKDSEIEKELPIIGARRASDPVIPQVDQENQKVTEAGICPPTDILHKICSKTLSTALKELVIHSLHDQNPKRQADDPIEPLSVHQVLRSCLSYATYNGCLLALAPNQECVPHRTVSLLLNTTYHLFCNTEILGNMSLHAGCLNRVKEAQEVKECRARYLGDTILPSAKFQVCEMVTNFYEFSQCIQGSVEKLCDLGAVNFLEDIQQAFVHELLKNHCEEISQLRLFQIQAEEAKKNSSELTTVLAASETGPLGFHTDPPAGETPLPFMVMPNEKMGKRKGKIENLGSSHLPPPRKRTEKRIFPTCSSEQEEAAKGCFKWVASLPHTGMNLPPNQWLMEMADQESGLISDTCTALRIYERCLEETVFRRDGRCAFRSWVPIHVQIAQNALCDTEVLDLLPQFRECLLEANATLDMDLCADMDIEIVRLIRTIYDSPGQDTTCPVLSRLRESYECISDVGLETCGRDILYVIGKIRMNVVRLAIEEGCSVCS